MLLKLQKNRVILQTVDITSTKIEQYFSCDLCAIKISWLDGYFRKYGTVTLRELNKISRLNFW